MLVASAAMNSRSYTGGHCLSIPPTRSITRGRKEAAHLVPAEHLPRVNDVARLEILGVDQPATGTFVPLDVDDQSARRLVLVVGDSQKLYLLVAHRATVRSGHAWNPLLTIWDKCLGCANRMNTVGHRGIILARCHRHPTTSSE